MSKAEERAFEVYPKMSRITEPHGIIPADYKSHYIGDANEEKRIGFVEGYRQAEKDLELTWEDVSKIISIDQQVCGTMGISDYTHNHQQAMEEVLKRFKERKVICQHT